MRISLATGRTATRLLGRHQRLDSSNKGAHELFIHLGRDRVNVDTLGEKKLARILHPVNTGRFNLDLFETRRCQFFAIFGLLQRSRDLPYPKQNALANLGGNLARVTTSDTANLPPGLSTLKASRKTRSLSAQRLITQFEMIRSTELSGRGMCRNSTFSAPALRLFSFVRASISPVISRP
jgi:hypothetical protein